MSSPSPSGRFDLRSMAGDEVSGLSHSQDLGGLLVGDADPVAVLQLDHQLNQVEGVGLEVLLEPCVLLNACGIHLELGGQVIADALENLVPGHRDPTLAAAADLKAPAASSARRVRSTMRSSTACCASRIALAMPLEPKLPCPTTTGLRSPRRIAPPTDSGSISS